MSYSIKVENISKQYRLGEVGTGTISHDLNRWWHKIRGKEDPYALVGDNNDRTKKSEVDYVWALKKLNFEVKPGEVLGIIGKNGAGKSTLLKLLSKVTGPTEGKMTINGRIGALLEVGTGMHPELTGRENIYLNGAILGMTKFEISTKFDEIVGFAGIQKYIDTPFKRYSSGMRVRLGFAVAAFLEPEILVVDEVLAVGDIEFQKKAIEKMQNISSSKNRTILFVSHNMTSVRKLCTRAIVLDKGEIVNSGAANDMINYYLSNNIKISRFGNIPDDYPRNDYNKNVVKFNRIDVFNEKSEKKSFFFRNEKIKMKFSVNAKKNVNNVHLIVRIGSSEKGDINYVSASNDHFEGINIPKGDSQITMTFDQNLLPGSYWISFSLLNKDGYPYDGIREFGELNIENIHKSQHIYPWTKKIGAVWNESYNLEIINNEE